MKKIIASLLMLMSVTAFAQTTVKTSVRDSILTNKDTIKITTAITTTVTYATHKHIPPTSTGTGTIVYTPSGPVGIKSGGVYKNLIIDLGNTTAAAFSAINVTGFTITNCKIIGGKVISNSNAAQAFFIQGCHNFTITNCFVNGVPQGFHLMSSYAYELHDNQLLDIVNSPSTLLHPFNIESCSGGGQHIYNNRIEELASIAPYAHDQISVYKSNGLRGDSILVYNNWIRGGQQVKNAAGNNGACGIGVGDSGGSFQSFHDNILVNALAIAIDGAGVSLHVYRNKIFAKQVAPQPLSVGIVYFGNPGNNWIESNQINFTGPNGSPNNLNPAKSTTIKGWSTNIVNANITASILPATIITMK